jgi:excisionase family DNA binding protein
MGVEVNHSGADPGPEVPARNHSLAEASLRVGVPVRTLSALALRGEIKVVRLGRRVLIPPKEMQRLLGM